MAYQLFRPCLPKFVKSIAVLLGATVLTNLAPNGALANATFRSPLVDGVYLYGQSTTPNQLGSAYMVFEVTGGHAVGAFYMPSSAFDCFSGNVLADRLDLTVTNSYEQASYPYTLDAQPTYVAGQGAEYAIEGYTALPNVSDTDQRFLETCQNVQAETI